MWIPKDKYRDIMQATNFAGSILRKTGNYNKALETACNYYKIEDDDVKYVKDQVAKRQTKGRKKSPKRVYKYYAINGHMGSERGGGINYYDKTFGNWYSVKATNEDNAIRQLSKNDNFSEHGSYFLYGEIKEFKSKKELQNFLSKEE